VKRPWIWGLAGLAIVLLAVALNIWINRPPGADEAEPAAAAPADQAALAPAIRASPDAKPTQSAPLPPSFDVVRVNPNGDAVLAGRAAPDARVTVLEGERIVGTATADHNGDWVLVPSEPLGAGDRELSLSARQADGAPLLSDKTVVIVVPGGKSASAGGGNALALLVPRAGAGASTLLQAPSDRLAASPPLSEASIGLPRAGAAAGGVSLDVIDYGDNGRLALAGRAASGAALRVYLDNALLGSPEADRQGVWRLTPERPVAPGFYHLRIDELSPSGQVLRRIELPFTRAALAPDLIGRERLVVQPGSSLWHIARETYGEGVRYSVIYEANREQIRDPDLIYPGQILTVPAAGAGR
jgi:nucleoid-associated protein YgaU